MKRNRRNNIVTTLLALLMVTILMGCASNEAAEETKKTETTVVKEEVEEVAEVKEETVEPTPEPTMEPTPEPTLEPTPEPIVYEGIDMESTLPGKEWVATFAGIIEEPKFVVFNDETNKKVIVENGQEVKFEEGDVLALFAPDNCIFGGHMGEKVETMTTSNNMYYSEIVFEKGYIIIKNTITVDTFHNSELGQITCTITP